MNMRPMVEMDWQNVPRFREQYPFDWKFPEPSDRIAAACVIENSAGVIAMCAAELVPSVTLAMDQTLHPTVRLRAGVSIHEYLREALKAYPELHCEVPPEIERSYGRHLQRIFGWREMWKGYKLKEDNHV